MYYYPLVKHHKKQFIMKYCEAHKISNQKIVKQWYTDIIEDEINHPIVLETIVTQMIVSDEFCIKLESEFFYIRCK